jgi:hypothetical protein
MVESTKPAEVSCFATPVRGGEPVVHGVNWMDPVRGVPPVGLKKVKGAVPPTPRPT